jgi:hypothetical protein
MALRHINDAELLFSMVVLLAFLPLRMTPLLQSYRLVAFAV